MTLSNSTCASYPEAALVTEVSDVISISVPLIRVRRIWAVILDVKDEIEIRVIARVTQVIVVTICLVSVVSERAVISTIDVAVIIGV